MRTGLRTGSAFENRPTSVRSHQPVNMNVTFCECLVFTKKKKGKKLEEMLRGFFT